MYINFFANQKQDDAGHMAVRLEIVLIILFIISLIILVVNIFLISTDTVALFWPSLAFSIVGWLMLLLGFLGAYLRSRPLILLFTILMIAIVLLSAISGVVVTLYIVDSAGCLSKSGCQESKLRITVFFAGIAEVVIGLIGLVLQIFTVVLSIKLLKLLRSYENMDLIYHPAQQPKQINSNSNSSSNVVIYLPPPNDQNVDYQQNPEIKTYQPAPYMPAPYSPTTPPTSPRASPPTSPKLRSSGALTSSLNDALELQAPTEKEPLLNNQS